VAALEKRYQGTVKFKADANAGWTPGQAKEFLEGVKDSRLSFIEQPIAKNDIDGLAKLTGGTKLLISVDESLTGMGRAQQIVAKKAATVFSIKSSKNGGPLRSKALCELAASHGIQCYFNSMVEGGITQSASLHLAVTRPNLLPIGHAFFSTRRLEGDVTNFASFVRDGVVHLPKGDGLGIEVDEAKVRHGASASRCVG
jgi:muconate cycloisomerase